jgi:hypothetical protein
MAMAIVCLLVHHFPRLGPPAGPPTITCFHFVHEYQLHGTVTGLESIRIMASYKDGLDRLLVSFRDAKVR